MKDSGWDLDEAGNSIQDSVVYSVFQSSLMEGKEKKQKESKNILCSRVSFKEGKECKIKYVVFPSFI
ncbi:hypothetical protein Hanom_Chr05g00394211 [Helianthus anomalus]